MTTVEDRARAAMRAAAGTVSEAPPLVLAEAPQARRGARRLVLLPPRWRGGSPEVRRWGGWLAPLAAAAAVLVVAASLVIVKNLGGNNPQFGGPVPVANAVPRYYVALDNIASGNLVIGDTFTGKRLAVVHSPTSDGFSGISAAADDRTFVVDTSSGGAANAGPPRTWYLLRLTPGTKPGYRLTRLPIPVLTNVILGAVALSGSGTELALGLEVSHPPQNYTHNTHEIRIYSVATGQLLHTWSTPYSAVPRLSVFGVGAGMYGELNRSLTWVDGDRAVVFAVMWLTRNGVFANTYEVMTMRRLDVSSGGGDLMGSSRVIWTSKSAIPTSNYPPGCLWSFNPLISADGKTIICLSIFGPPYKRGANQKEIVTWKFSWQAYSVAAPTVAHDIYQFTVRAPRSGAGSSEQMWADTAGDTATVYWYLVGGAAKGLHFGSIKDGRFTPLPVPAGLSVNDGPPSITWLSRRKH
jgi:hypothetical protein